MNKMSKAGYMMSLDDAMKYWTRCQEAEKALGAKLTRDERAHLLKSMQLGQELTVEDLLDYVKDKKTLIIRGDHADSV